MKHAIAHDLTPDLIRRATDAALQSYSRRFSELNPVVLWETPQHASISFKAKGISMGGTLDILPQAIELEMDVPLLMRPFRNKALELIEREVRTWIDRAKTGSLDAVEPTNDAKNREDN